MHPADELRAVRAEIARLTGRAEMLASMLIAGGDRHGADWIALVETRVDRRIDEAALPLSVRADPRSWAERRRTEVTLLPRPGMADRRDGPEGWLDDLPLLAPEPVG